MSLGGSSKGSAPPKTWTGFKLADLERLRGMAGSIADLAGGTDLEKVRPKIATLGEKVTVSKRQVFSPTKGWHTQTTVHQHNKPTEELVDKEEGGDEVQRLMGLFRKRQQEVVRGKAAPGRKALRAQGIGDY